MSNTIGKAALVERIAQRVNGPKNVAEKYLEAVVGVITDALCAGEDVAVKNFGKFHLAISSTREGRNPQDATKVIKISPKISTKFKAGSELAKSVNTKEVAAAISKANPDNPSIQERVKFWKAAKK